MLESGPPPTFLDRFCEVSARLYSDDRVYRDVAAQLAGQDAKLFTIPARGRIAAFQSRIKWNGKKIGIIGYYECEDNLETARKLVDAAAGWLAGEGTQVIIGPMDGSTWHRYRFKIDTPRNHTSPSYFLNNYHKSWYPEQFVALGFEAVSKYYSTLLPLDPSASAKSCEGILIRAFRASALDEDLHLIYRISMEGFRDNMLFSPISWDEFLNIYKPIVPVVDPRLVVFAEDSGKTIGFCFAIPDQMERSRIVVKSAAVLECIPR